MANRRMFSNKIINSAKFIKMPPSTQMLYFHLGLNADDDGVVEAFPIMRMLNVSEDDLKILIVKEYIKVLNDDFVSYILHWNEHNNIRADRHIASIYRDLLIQVIQDVRLTNSKPRSDIKQSKLLISGQSTDSPMSVHGQPMDGIGKDRLGKDRLGKDRLGKVKNITINKKLKIKNEPWEVQSIIDHFNSTFQTNKYQKGSDRVKVAKYIEEMLNAGDELTDIKLLIDYKKSNPNTKNIDLTSWLNTKYAGDNMSKAKNWLNNGCSEIKPYGEEQSSNEPMPDFGGNYENGGEWGQAGLDLYGENWHKIRGFVKEDENV